MRRRRRRFTRGVGVGVGAVLGLSACVEEGPPSCDEFDWSIDLERVSGLPEPDFEVVCATDWAAAMSTWAPAQTRLLPVGHDRLYVHPKGGYLVDLGPHGVSSWSEWHDLSESLGEADPSHARTLWVDENIEGLWSSRVERVRVDGLGQLWGIDPGGALSGELGTLDLEAASWVRIDADDGTIMIGSAWSFPPGAEALQVIPAVAGEPGLWFEIITPIDGSDYAQLYRMTSLEGDPALISQRPYTNTAANGMARDVITPLPGGGVARTAGRGQLEVYGADGSPGWKFEAPSEAFPSLPSIAANGEGLGVIVWGEPLQMRGVSMADGSTLWERRYQRYAVAPGELCEERGCSLVDQPLEVHPSPGGGWVVVALDTWPNLECAFQPLALEFDVEGVGLRGHRIGTCGLAGSAGFDGSGALVLTGQALDGGSGAERFLRRLEP